MIGVVAIGRFDDMRIDAAEHRIPNLSIGDRHRYNSAVAVQLYWKYPAACEPLAVICVLKPCMPAPPANAAAPAGNPELELAAITTVGLARLMTMNFV